MEPPRHQDAKTLRSATSAAQLCFFVAIAIWMWLAMLVFHELGHVGAAWATGGRIVHVDIYPGRLPSTLVQPNPRPGIVLWAGVLSGWLAPIAVAGVSCWSPPLVRNSLRCWAAFCLLAGGAYLAAGGLERFSDTGLLVREGWSLPLLIFIGVAAGAIGYAWSRTAWPELLRVASETNRPAVSAAVVWLLLTAWVAGQWWLAGWLEAFPNVR